MSLSGSFSAAGAPSVSVRVDAAAAADRRGVVLAPVAALVTLRPGWFPLAQPGLDALAGDFTVELLTPAEADTRPVDHRRRLPGHVLLPGLINAHTHLDLTDLGPLEDAQGDFPRFIDHVRTHRASDEAAISAAVGRGAALSLAGGVVAVGDIAGCPRSGPTPAPFNALAASGLGGVSFLEFFAIGDRARTSVERALGVVAGLTPTRGVRAGLQPHAPYSVEPEAYRAALEYALARGITLATHAAESLAEREFIAHATGPHRAMLESLGLWSPRLEREFGLGRTPLEHLDRVLNGGPCLLVHGNDISDDDLSRLASRAGSGVVVAYCPRSSAYFEAPRHFGPHRYRELLARGVPVCLGTDSILNLPKAAADPARGGISVLDEARLLFRRDRTPAPTLMGMMTTHGALALGLEPGLFEFAPRGGPATMQGLIAVRATDDSGHSDPLEAILSHDDPARLLFLRNLSGLTAKK